MTKDLSPVMCDHDGKPAIIKTESNTTNVVNGNQCQKSLPGLSSYWSELLQSVEFLCMDWD